MLPFIRSFKGLSARCQLSLAGRSLTATALTFLLATQSYSAPPPSLPSGGKFTAGTGSITASNNAVNITQSSSRGIINWNDFSIGLGRAVNFKNGSGATLNRVTGGNLSVILGSLNATGSVYLINPEGVLIGPKGSVHTGGDFVASTLNVSDDVFLKGGPLSFVGDSNSVVKNLGNLYSNSGSIFLIATGVENAGTIHAPKGTVGLAAGRQVLLKDSSSDERVFVQAAGADVTNSGKISAAQAELKASGGNIYALAGNDGGQISATGTATRDGHVWLVSDGGSTTVSSSISARNADGKGGQIETSGAHVSTAGASIKTGTGGSWLLDPEDLTIDSAAATTIQDSLNAGTNVTEQTTSTVASGAGNTASGNGDINVANNIAWGGSATLTLSAYRNININSGNTISNSGSGNLVLRADNSSTGTGTVNLNGTLDFSQSTGNISLFYNPIGSAATKYNAPQSYEASLNLNSSWAAPANQSVSSQFTPYMLVNNPTDLQNVSTNLGGTYALGKDIDASSVSNFTPIATATTQNGTAGFTGIFDGQNHTISNLTVNDTTNYYVGLFGYVGGNGKVRNLNLSNESVTGNLPNSAENEVGGVAGHNDGTIASASVSGVITAITSNTPVGEDNARPWAGGLVGGNHGAIYNSFAAGSVSGGGQQPWVGGLVGFNDGSHNITGNITASYSSASVSSNSTDPNWANVGGLVGYNDGQISSSYATGAVTCSGQPAECGGLVGYNDWVINSSYATGQVAALAGSDAGGVIGYNTGQANSTYWDKQTTGQSTSGAGVSGGDPSGQTGYTTAQLKTGTLPSGFSTTYWQPATNGYYPLLSWQAVPQTNIDITGNVYNAGTLVGTGITVSGFAGGLSLGSVTTNSSGMFDLTAPLGTTGVLVYLTGANKANTFSDGGGTSSFTNVDLIYGTIRLMNQTSSTYSGIMSALSTALGANSNANLLFSMSGGNLMPTVGTGLSILNTSSSLNLNLPINFGSATVAINSSGAVTQSQPLTAGALELDGTGSFNLTNASNAISNLATSTSGSQSVATSGALTVGSVGSDYGINANGTVSLTAGGDLTLAVGSDWPFGYSIGAVGSGTALTLATGGKFVNQVGSGALTVAGGGRWLIYSQNPANDTRGGLTYGFKQYAATYGVTTPAQSTGNGFLYSVAPSLTPGLTGTVSKTYNGLTSATVSSANLTATGLLDGDAATLTASSATYDNKNAATNKSVTANGISISSVTNGSANVYGYGLASNSALANVGTITAASLTGSVTASNKTYDGTTMATGSLTVSGVVGGDVVSATGASFTFADKNVANGKAVSQSGATLTGTDAGNYILGSISSGTANITPAPVTALIAVDNKVYDGTTTATGFPYGLNDVIGADVVSLGGLATYAFAEKNVGNNKTVTAAGLHLTGLDAANYTLGAVTGSANITPAPLTASVLANNKMYNGTTAATGSIGLSGIIGADDVSASAGYAFSDKNVGNGKTVSASTATLSGVDAANYTLETVSSGTANITPAILTGFVAGNNKTYDGMTATTGSLTLGGVVIGDDVSTSNASYAFIDKNVANDKLVTESGATLSGADAGNYTLGFVFGGVANITPATLTASIAANNKIYDRTTATTGSLTLHGVVVGDDVSTGNASYAFANKNIGTNKPVAESGATLTGADAGNYILGTVSDGSADITPATLTASIAANNKVYDGTTAATGSVTLNGVIEGDTVSTTGASFTFANKNVANNKAVNQSGATLTGADAGNYTLNSIASGTANITPAPLTGSISANNKTYDGTTAATGNLVLNGAIGTDDVSAINASYAFSDKNVANNKIVTQAGVSLTGTDAGNYTLDTVSNGTANITPAMLTASIAANNKVYDGTTVATGMPGTLTGVIGGDQVNLSGSGTYAFTNKNAGTNKTVTGTGLNLSGTDAANYTLVAVTGRADITPATLTGSVAANGKIYDGSTSATGSLTLNGILGLDDVSTVNASYAFANKTAGTNKTVTESGAALTGTDATNYTLGTVSTGTANITPAALTASIAANNKTYDGTTAATGNMTLNGVLGQDSVSTANATYSFSDKNAANGKTVFATGAGITGSDAGNYTLSAVSNGTANIAPAMLTGTVAANSKTYDGTAAATGTPAALNGVLGSDRVNLNGPGTYTFADKNVGSDKTVTASGLSLVGTDAGNYTLGAVTGTANITPAMLTYASDTASRPAGTANPTLTGSVLGFAGTDTLASATTGTLAFTTPANLSSPLGQYPIFGSGLAATNGNYIFTQASGNSSALAVTAPTTPIIITVNSVTRFTSQQNPQFSASYNGPVVPGIDVTGILNQLTYKTSATDPSAAGVYQISATLANAPGGYTINIQPGTLTVVDNSPRNLPTQAVAQSTATQAGTSSTAGTTASTSGGGTTGVNYSPLATGPAVTPNTLGNFDVNYSPRWSDAFATQSQSQAKPLANSSFLNSEASIPAPDTNKTSKEQGSHK